MKVTIELPEELIRQAIAAGIRAEEVSRYAAAGAVSAVSTAVDLTGRSGPADAIDEIVAAAEEMEADTKAGRLLTLEQVDAEAKAFWAARRALREPQQPAEGALR